MPENRKHSFSQKRKKRTEQIYVFALNASLGGIVTIFINMIGGGIGLCFVVLVFIIIVVYSMWKMGYLDFLKEGRERKFSEFAFPFKNSSDFLENFYDLHDGVSVDYKKENVWNNLLMLYCVAILMSPFPYLLFFAYVSLGVIKITAITFLLLIAYPLLSILYIKLSQNQDKIQLFLASKYPSIVSYDLDSPEYDDYSIVFDTEEGTYRFKCYEDRINKKIEKKIKAEIENCESKPYLKKIFLISFIQNLRRRLVILWETISKIIYSGGREPKQ